MSTQLPQRPLGTSGLQASAIGLGCMSLSDWTYGAVSEAEAVRLVHHTLDHGITLLDTADVYGPYTSEEIVGKAIKGRREQVILATKGGQVIADPATRALMSHGSPAYLKAACEHSLRRLGGEVIELVPVAPSRSAGAHRGECWRTFRLHLVAKTLNQRR